MKYNTMRVNVAIVLNGCARIDDVERLVEHIRHKLLLADNKIGSVVVELTAVGYTAGTDEEVTHLRDLLVTASQLQQRLLNGFLLHRHQDWLNDSLRLAHAITVMDKQQIRKIMAKDHAFPGL